MRLLRDLPRLTRALVVAYAGCFAVVFLAALLGGPRSADEGLAVLGGLAALLGLCLLGDVHGTADAVAKAVLTSAPPTREADRLQVLVGRKGVVRAVGAVLVVAGAAQVLAGAGHPG